MIAKAMAWYNALVMANPLDNSSNHAENPEFRKVRSYVLRGGRLTEGQKRALEQLWPEYGVDLAEGSLEFDQLFGNTRPVVLDIGFGSGESTLKLAEMRPDENFLGVEVHPPGVGHLLLNLRKRDIKNVKVVCADAVALLQSHIADQQLQGMCLFFPDPWPKKRHHKRRIVQASFIDLLENKMRPGGFLHMATDWTPYAEHMLEVIEPRIAFKNCSPSGDYCSRPEWRAMTKYERRGQRLGHQVHDMIFEKTA
jgi:tRNA (guanine-N7-)-methyltransferase